MIFAEKFKKIKDINLNFISKWTTVTAMMMLSSTSSQSKINLHSWRQLKRLHLTRISLKTFSVISTNSVNQLSMSTTWRNSRSNIQVFTKRSLQVTRMNNCLLLTANPKSARSGNQHKMLNLQSEWLLMKLIKLKKSSAELRKKQTK